MKINLRKFAVDQKTRQITFSCASETPYVRYDQDRGYEYEQILIVNEDTVDFSRLNTENCPLLFNHDTDKLIGIVKKAFIADNKVYVRVEFSKNSDLAQRIYRDILDGIMKNVSIGYVVLEFQDVREQDVIKRYVSKWMPYQVSTVSIAADPNVGFRSLNTNVNIKHKELKMEQDKTKECGQTDDKLEVKSDAEVEEAPAEEKTDAENPAEEKAEVEEAPAEEKAEEDVITQAEIDALVEENKKLKAEIEELKKDENDNEDKVEETPEDEAEKEEIEKIGEDFGVSEEEVKRAINDKLTVREFKNKVKTLININTNNNKKEQKMNREFTDFLKARDYNKTFVMRDFTGFAPAGIVPTETLPIEKILELKMAVNGYRSISGIRGNITVPVQTSRATVYTPGVNQASTDSVPGVTNKTLSAVKFTASVVIGKEALELSNSDSEAFIIGQITDEIAYKFEAYLLGKVLSGAGTTINYSAISAVDWDDILAFEAAVAPYNINQPYFVMSAGSRASLKGILKAQNTAARFICEDNRINDYEARVSGCISDSNIYFGDFSKLLVANFGNGLEITIDPYTEARSGNIVVVGSYLADAAVLHADAFAIGKTQSSSSSSSSNE